MKRTLRIAGLTLLAFGSMAAIAWAVDQTNGTGKTNEGATIGYNVQEDLSGNLQYDNGTYKLHCNDYTKYKDAIIDATPGSQVYKSWANSNTCFAQEGGVDPVGTRYYVHIEFVDKGEPGTTDRICFVLKYYPGSTSPVLERDCGVIQNGNVQIHSADNDPDRVGSAADYTEMLVPVE